MTVAVLRSLRSASKSCNTLRCKLSHSGNIKFASEPTDTIVVFVGKGCDDSLALLTGSSDCSADLCSHIDEAVTVYLQ
jgi:hypothetical protein